MAKTIKAYLVGGAVRDQLLGVKSKDLDYAVEASSYDEMLDWIKDQKGKIFLQKPEFWTVRANINGKAADYVLTRKDGQYSDGRRPDSVEPGTLLEDLSRRDFTMNAIAYDEETRTYIDPFNGQQDLQNSWLRCVGSAHARFEEDALRMLRALRFAITRNVALDGTIHAALQSDHLINCLRDNISMERKREELTKCFRHDTFLTLHYLNKYTAITKACFHLQNLWLMPTLQET